MALPFALTRDLTDQDRRKLATIVLTMTIGLPVYTVLMSLTGIIDVPMTSLFLGLTSIIGFVMSLLMMLSYLIANNFTS